MDSPSFHRVTPPLERCSSFIFEPFICQSAPGTGIQIGYEKEEWESDDEYEELDAQYSKWLKQFPEGLKVNTTLTKIDLRGILFLNANVDRDSLSVVSTPFFGLAKASCLPSA